MASSDSATAPAVPEGYLLFNDVPGQLVSKEGLERYEKLMQEADECNPDLQGCYIYNRFYAWACIHIMESQLFRLNRINIKQHGMASKECLDILEGLTLFMALETSHGMIDDPACFDAIARVYGAACFTVCSHLQEKKLLNNEFAPHASNLFLTAERILHAMNDKSGDLLSNAGQSLRVMLARAGLPFQKKKYAIEDQDDDQEEEEDIPDVSAEDLAKGNYIEIFNGNRSDASDEDDQDDDFDPAQLAMLTHKQAEKELFCDRASCSYGFMNQWRVYSRAYCFPEFWHDEGFNITQWPEQLRKLYEFGSREED